MPVEATIAEVAAVHSTMMDYPLTITQIFEHGRKVHSGREVVTWHGDHARRVTFADTAERVGRLANALAGLGVGPGDVVGTFAWNRQEHVEAYFAVPCMGAVLHTLNIRLFPDQLAYVIQDGGDKVIVVDDSVIPALAQVADRLGDVEHLIVVGDGDASTLGRDVLRYDDLIAGQSPVHDWPELDERSAAAMCYSSGTTGNPKGVVYSHRSSWCHTFGVAAGGVKVEEGDRALVIVPQFHANAWGLVYICWALGADILMPERHLTPEPLAAFIAAERPTLSEGVPTVFNGLLTYGEEAELDLSSLRRVMIGGSAVPRSMIEAFRDRYGVEVIQGWGLTESSPVAAVAIPPAGATADDELDWRAKAGRILPGIDLRIVGEDGDELPWDGKSVGEVEVRGPWVTAGYFGVDADDKFRDGWLRTGDVGSVDDKGFLTITDRTKDVIKSGGEWISSVDLENAIMGHPDVLEAAVVSVPDDKWSERPLACVVRREGSDVGPDQLAAYVADHVAGWWIPERWTFIDEVPKTSVGKFDKKVLRRQQDDGTLTIETVGD